MHFISTQFFYRKKMVIHRLFVNELIIRHIKMESVAVVVVRIHFSTHTARSMRRQFNAVLFEWLGTAGNSGTVSEITANIICIYKFKFEFMPFGMIRLKVARKMFRIIKMNCVCALMWHHSWKKSNQITKYVFSHSNWFNKNEMFLVCLLGAEIKRAAYLVNTFS